MQRKFPSHWRNHGLNRLPRYSCARDSKRFAPKSIVGAPRLDTAPPGS